VLNVQGYESIAGLGEDTPIPLDLQISTWHYVGQVDGEAAVELLLRLALIDPTNASEPSIGRHPNYVILPYSAIPSAGRPGFNCNGLAQTVVNELGLEANVTDAGGWQPGTEDLVPIPQLEPPTGP
jgi:cell wall-associated NlpC family hydrolase